MTLTLPSPRPVTAREHTAPTAQHALVLLGALTLVAGLGAIHLTQGNAAHLTFDVLVASRIPRLLAAILVGLALGAAGTTMQALARNPLASPDTLAVNAGAKLGLTVTAACGLHLGLWFDTATAFFGGLAAAGLVLMLAGRTGSPVRLVLAGSALTLGLMAIASALILVASEETQGLFAWGAGTLSQPGLDAVIQLAPLILLTLTGLIVRGDLLDLLQLGDDTARALGVHIGRTRIAFTIAAVMLAACAVTIAGPVGFLGLCSPPIARWIARRLRYPNRMPWQLSLAALTGALLLLGADVLLRAVLGAQAAVEIPSGVVTTLMGGLALLILGRSMRSGTVGDSPAAIAGRGWPSRHPVVTIVAALVALLVTATLALLPGELPLLLGDVANWLQAQASSRITWILDARFARVVVSLAAGAALALAGALVQAVTRNPLADPGLLGVSGGAGVGALMVITSTGTGSLILSFGALTGATVSAALLFLLAARSGWDPTRLVLAGLGLNAASGALTTFLIVSTDPWNKTRAVTWLGGSSYGAQLDRAVPVLVALGAATFIAVMLHRRLDLIQLDAVTPAVVGAKPKHTRAVVLVVAVVLTAAATSAIGVISFVGLAAPHASRMLLGGRHRVHLPLTAILGALLVVFADAVARTVLSPIQLPVGIVCALVGLPFFAWLLHRMRVSS